ncbi:hypothetical protein [Streptomyces platensis]|uniref:hypothetical protein n=1 Tax=Streptomyces platensis TaxID=58346 RepID=UPI0036AC8BF7
MLTGIEMQQLEDEYGHAREQLVAAKLEGGEVSELPMPKPAVDLLTALEQSVQAARHSRPYAGRPAAHASLCPATIRLRISEPVIGRLAMYASSDAVLT